MHLPEVKIELHQEPGREGIQIGCAVAPGVPLELGNYVLAAVKLVCADFILPMRRLVDAQIKIDRAVTEVLGQLKREKLIWHDGAKWNFQPADGPSPFATEATQPPTRLTEMVKLGMLTEKQVRDMAMEKGYASSLILPTIPKLPPQPTLKLAADFEAIRKAVSGMSPSLVEAAGAVRKLAAATRLPPEHFNARCIIEDDLDEDLEDDEWELDDGVYDGVEYEDTEDDEHELD